MPIREYQAKDIARGCVYCRRLFEQVEPAGRPPLQFCARCGAAVVRLISAPAVGGSRSGFDARAKSAGFSKLKRLGHGEYEKQY
mgnify:CR=1 FL=1